METKKITINLKEEELIEKSGHVMLQKIDKMQKDIENLKIQNVNIQYRYEQPTTTVIKTI